MKLVVHQSLSLPAHAGRANEDACGTAAGCAFVIDGATGLGDNLLVGRHGSDAAWLAQFARVHLEEMTRPGRPLPAIVRHICLMAARIVDYAADGQPVPPWQLPVAGFSMLRVEGGRATVHGLGDCVLIATDDTGTLFHHCPMDGQAEAERAYAQAAIAKAGGLSNVESLVKDPATLELLRAGRAAYNTDGGNIWLLGTSPGAADHVDSAPVTLERPFTGLLMSDGFAALWQNYTRYEPAELIAAACERGLQSLADELRHIETVEDPEGTAHPRFKVSDDATAVLVRVE